MPRTLSSAAERLLQAAMGLFAAQGYEHTSVGEIQEAAGLTFGSGALYKHFEAKEAVLAEGMERFLERAAEERRIFHDLDRDRDSVAAALRRLASALLRASEEERTLWRVAWRDLQAFPHLMARVRTERLRATFDLFAQWVAGQAESGAAVVDDPVAFSAVALSSLAFFGVLRLLLDDTPAGVSEDRFVSTWVDLFADALTKES